MKQFEQMIRKAPTEILMDILKPEHSVKNNMSIWSDQETLIILEEIKKRVKDYKN